MIIIKNRKLLIPEYERYIGTTADSNSEVLTFRIDRYTQTEMDLSAFTVKADIFRCETEETDRADLEMEVQDNYILLYLYITSGMVAYPGTILIDIKAFNDDGTVKWSSYKGAFYVEDPFATPQATLENLTELEQLEARVNRAIATANERAIETAENWLDENVHPETGYVIDNSLSIRGAAADAKSTGDAVAAEASARAAGDSRLSEAINAEASARAAGDSHLSTAINAEAATRAAQDASLQSQIDQIIAPSGEAPSAAEVQNARVGADGMTYSTLGDAIRGQVTTIKNSMSFLGDDFTKVTDMEKEQTFAKYSSACVIGGLNNGVLNPSQTWRVSTRDMIFTPYDLDFKITTGYRVAIQTYSGGAYSDSGWQTGSYSVPGGTEFKFTIEKTGSYAQADVNTFLSQMTYTFPLIESFEKVKNAAYSALYLKSDFTQHEDIAAVGGLSNGEIDTSKGWRVSSTSTLMVPFDTDVKIASGFQFSISTFENGSFVRDYGWQTGIFTIPGETDFKFTIQKTNSFSAADIPSFLEAISYFYPEFRALTDSDMKYPYVYIMKDYDLITQIQDAVLVNGLIYQFTGGGENIGDYNGHIIIIDPETLELYDNRYHDLGHCTCLGYDAHTDVLFSGRVINGIPKIQIYKRFAESATEGSILSPSDANCMTIDLLNSVLGGRTSFDVTLGENRTTLYAYCTTLSESANVVLLYKVLLGTGTTDLSADADGYGTFVSASDGDYNGTCKILASWTLPAVNRQPQLIRWHHGGLYMMTSNHDTIIHKYKYVGGRFDETEQCIISDIDATGATVDMEAESIVFDGLRTYIGLWDKTSPTKMRLLSVAM